MSAGIVVSLAGLPLAALAWYQLTLAFAAFFARDGAPPGPPTTRVAVVVPAHDEEVMIERCVRSLCEQDYPRELFEIVVVADNCTDATAARAQAAGARVLTRTAPDDRGKGRALRWAFDRLARELPAPDAFVVVDADSVAAPSLVPGLVRRFEAGAAAVQGESLLFDGGTPRAALRAAAFLLINRVRPSGRAVLGRPTRLAGNGMLLGRDLLAAHPWNAFSTTEDLEYSVELRTAGIGVAFARGAIVQSPVAPTGTAALEQQLRWEGGKLHFMRTSLPRIAARAVRERRLDLLDEALELAMPPLGLLVLLAGGGAAVAAALVSIGAAPGWAVGSWCAALAAVHLYVLVGLRAAKAPLSAYRAIIRAPVVVLAKLRHLRRFASFRADSWVRTERT